MPSNDSRPLPSNDWRAIFDLGEAPGRQQAASDTTLTSPSGKSLLFIVPAWRRVKLSRVCFRQQADTVQRLRTAGLDAQVVVVANDDNLEAAAACGHLTIEMDNRLGAKLNAGYRYAADNGFDYVCALGSDSWIHPDRFQLVPGHCSMLCDRNFVCVDGIGSRQGWFRVTYEGGIGSRCIPTGMLAGCDYAPVQPGRMSGCDTDTLRTIRKHVTPNLVYTDIHPFTTVGFQSAVQITSYGRLINQFLQEWQTPFSGLSKHYPARLVKQIRALYKGAA